MDPQNSSRIAFIHTIMETYQAYRGHQASEEVLTDILTDLLHAAHVDGTDFDQALSFARMHFTAEQELVP